MTRAQRQAYQKRRACEPAGHWQTLTMQDITLCTIATAHAFEQALVPIVFVICVFGVMLCCWKRRAQSPRGEKLKVD